MIRKIFVNCKQGYGNEIRKEVREIIRETGAEYTERITKDIELGVLIGGDGTLMKFQWRLGCPLMGINPGSSEGFYMTSGPNDFRKNLMSAMRGKKGEDYFIREMMRLETRLNGKPLEPLAINDVLVSAVYTRKILDSRVRVNGKTSLERGSGILVYTPTGSNAFAHSAGAKAIDWDSSRIGVTEIAPFKGRLKRGEILASGEVRITCMNNEGEVCIDGQEDQTWRLKKGDTVSVRKNRNPARIIGFGKTFR